MQQDYRQSNDPPTALVFSLLWCAENKDGGLGTLNLPHFQRGQMQNPSVIILWCCSCMQVKITFNNNSTYTIQNSGRGYEFCWTLAKEKLIDNTALAFITRKRTKMLRIPHHQISTAYKIKAFWGNITDFNEFLCFWIQYHSSSQSWPVSIPTAFSQLYRKDS